MQIFWLLFYNAFIIFSLLAHGPTAGFAETEKSIFLSAMRFIWSLNPEKAAQEAYIVWREFCISTGPAPRSWCAIHARRGHGQSMLCCMTGAYEKGRTNLSIPGPGFVSARSLWGHTWRFKTTECIMSCQALILFPHTVQHWKHSGRVWQLVFSGGVQIIAACFIKDVSWVRIHPKLCSQKPQVCCTSSSQHSTINIPHENIPSCNMPIFPSTSSSSPNSTTMADVNISGA